MMKQCGCWVGKVSFFLILKDSGRLKVKGYRVWECYAGKGPGWNRPQAATGRTQLQGHP